MVGAGILPIALHKGTIFFLLGQERNGLYSDFGGSGKRAETLINTAKRECYEELNGLYSYKYIDYLINNKLVDDIKCDRYVSYIVKDDYLRLKSLTYFFNNNCEFINSIDNFNYLVDKDNGLLEKNKLKLVSYDELLDCRLRPFYKNILKKITQEKYEQYLHDLIYN